MKDNLNIILETIINSSFPSQTKKNLRAIVEFKNDYFKDIPLEYLYDKKICTMIANFIDCLSNINKNNEKQSTDYMWIDLTLRQYFDLIIKFKKNINSLNENSDILDKISKNIVSIAKKNNNKNGMDFYKTIIQILEIVFKKNYNFNNQNLNQENKRDLNENRLERKNFFEQTSDFLEKIQFIINKYTEQIDIKIILRNYDKFIEKNYSDESEYKFNNLLSAIDKSYFEYLAKAFNPDNTKLTESSNVLLNKLYEKIIQACKKNPTGDQELLCNVFKEEYIDKITKCIPDIYIADNAGIIKSIDSFTEYFFSNLENYMKIYSDKENLNANNELSSIEEVNFHETNKGLQ
jgi:hypothetical protein